MRYRHFALLATLLAVVAGFPANAVGAINPGGVVNAASFMPAGVPGSMIARGSMFNVFGSDMAPAGLIEAAGFPLPTELAGVSIEVEVDGVTSDCYLIFTTPGQLAAILPSDAGLGTGVIRVNFSGQVFEESIDVTASSFGIFSVMQSGAGPGIVQNFVSDAETPLNGLTTAANAGQAIIIWGTGLGGVAGAEGAGPLPTAKPEGVTVQVYIEGREATLLDYGRSGEFAGIDQIAVFVPEGVSSCSSPVQVVTTADGVTTTSNTVTIATAPSGSTCSDPGGLDSSQIPAEGNQRFAFIMLERNNVGILDPTFGEVVSFGDGVDGRFMEADAPSIPAGAQIDLAAGRPGSCRITPVSVRSVEEPVGPGIDFLDVGEPLTLRGPGDRVAEVTVGGFGAFFAILSQGTSMGGGDAPFYLPGTYNVSAPGGADVGAFEVDVEIPEFLEWTNTDIASVNRSAGVTVSWTGGAPGREVVQISGVSTRANAAGNQVGAAFTCWAEPAAGQFTVPRYVLSALPANDLPAGGLTVGSWSLGTRFDADGIDFGYVQYKSLRSRGGVRYQ